VGLVSPDKIPPLLGASDIVVHASLREGLARVLPQALIAGRPVIAYDIDGAREVAIPGVTGFLLPPKSVEPMVEAIVALAGNPALRGRLGGEGRRRYAEVFDHHHMTRRIRKLYQEVFERNTGRPADEK
jgi:glycosyltransferase involved in cell wall biosynthesis